jgi:hypothetical protein
MKSKISVILFLFISLPCLSQTDFHILSSDANSFIVEYTPKISDTNFIKINNENFLSVSFKGNIYENKTSGFPSVPYFAFPLGVPSEFGNTIQVLNSSYKEINGKIKPVSKLKKIGGIPTDTYEQGDKYNSFNTMGEDLAGFGEFGLVRGVPIQTIIIRPVQFNAAGNRIRIYTKLVIKVNFSSVQSQKSVADDELLPGVIKNYSVAKHWQTVSNKLNKTKGVVNSVLSTGKWYKFETPNEGVYKITKSMLSSLGIDAGVDPRTIKIYNNGGKVLPENVNLPAPTDLVENAIYFSGDSSATFNDADYILFYGKGTNFWDYDTVSKSIKRMFDPYSDQNFYWITSGGANGIRMQNKKSEDSVNVNYKQNSSKAFAYWHKDIINIAQSGRYFVGDVFNPATISRVYINMLDNLLPGTRIDYSFYFINGDPASNIELKLDENGNTIYDSSIPGINTDPNPDYSYGVPIQAAASFTGNIPNNGSLLKFTFNASSAASKGYINWFEIYYNKALAPSNDNLIFFSKDTSAKIEYDLNSFSNSNIRVYDITDYSNVKIISNPLLLSASQFNFIASENQGFVSKYLAVGNDNFMTPVNPVSAVNSNIHGYLDGAKLIIITPKDFMDQAVRLKSFKENHPKLNISTYIADIEQVYNEFSCGMKDVGGIRNFLKYAYDNWTVKPEYVLLFGDGTYDYKNIEGLGNNYIIPYETANIVNLIDSYPMDDFYVEVSGADNLVDMGIGRITANSLSDAQIAVDKIISYETDNSKGAWQNLITMVADDQWTTQGYEGNYHVEQSEDLATNHIPVSFDINKIYLGQYPTVITSLGRTKPGVTEDLVKAINNGSILVNFIGHGSPELWTHERVFENSTTIPRLINNDLFFLTAATCDFGYYDLPSTQSGAELLVMKQGSGAIGSVTSARPVYSDQNSALNNQFYDDLLGSPRDTLNLPIPVGMAYFHMKQVRTAENDQKYHLFGDPSLRLSLPQFTANIDSVNGQTLSANVQIKALSNTKIIGKILKPDNSLWTNFNGQGILSVFDSQRQTTMVEQPDITINLQGGIIFRGQVSVSNGRFNSSFIVPKDISYENQNGKVVFLFYDSNADGLGYTTNVVVGGTDTTVVNDKTGPKIDIYFDDVTFKNAYLVNPDSKLIVKLSDPTGLNTTGTGIGHKIQGVLNDDINNPIDFTSYFTGDLDAGGKSGQVNYQFNNLNEGHYKLQVNAWDVFNNFSDEITYFDVVSGNSLTVSDVYNYPNPFSGKTTFTFQQNLNKTLDVKIKIYTVAGRLIKVIDSYGVHNKYVTIDWDGKDADGSLIANGVYFYKIILKSTDDSFSQSVIGKLAVVR